MSAMSRCRNASAASAMVLLGCSAMTWPVISPPDDVTGNVSFPPVLRPSVQRLERKRHGRSPSERACRCDREYRIPCHIEARVCPFGPARSARLAPDPPGDAAAVGVVDSPAVILARADRELRALMHMIATLPSDPDFR